MNCSTLKAIMHPGHYSRATISGGCKSKYHSKMGLAGADALTPLYHLKFLPFILKVFLETAFHTGIGFYK